jgi:hypothetical protein
MGKDFFYGTGSTREEALKEADRQYLEVYVRRRLKCYFNTKCYNSEELKLLIKAAIEDDNDDDLVILSIAFSHMNDKYIAFSYS